MPNSQPMSSDNVKLIKNMWGQIKYQKKSINFKIIDKTATYLLRAKCCVLQHFVAIKTAVNWHRPLTFHSIHREEHSYIKVTFCFENSKAEV